jgi:predicted DNA-binding transcriptional regulator YafY
MRRADRLFDIIQMLRVAVQPMTAAMIAERLEVTVRTVYRDIATLQARRHPHRGCSGAGVFAAPRLRLATTDVYG